MKNHDLRVARIATTGRQKSHLRDCENRELISSSASQDWTNDEIVTIGQMTRFRRSPLPPSRFLELMNKKTTSAKAFPHRRWRRPDTEKMPETEKN
ncbi:hypothetical protein TIFTF001_003140 [Ficus carica]|uniref:Uncharacterized protein n=1 Tax=Ficus carica TaxID=3494 RepID=A0AA87ZR59_FICCA|nr:hypothetical protein TIFTF001_003140 [Ficus carica]